MKNKAKQKSPTSGRVTAVMVHVEYPCPTKGCRHKARGMGIAKLNADNTVGAITYRVDHPCLRCAKRHIAEENRKYRKQLQQAKWRGKKGNLRMDLLQGKIRGFLRRNGGGTYVPPTVVFGSQTNSHV